MAEYAGYVASQPIDFGKIGTGLVSNLISIQEKKAEYDEKKQLALEKQQEKEDLLIDKSNEKIQDQINKEISSTGSQNLQRLSSQAVYEAANTAAQLGRMAKADRSNSYAYTQKAQSLARNVGNLRQVYADYGKGYQEILKLSASQDLDPLGEAMAKVYAQGGDLNGVNAKIANDEKIVFYKEDPSTGEVVVMDPEVYTDYNRFVSKKVDYNKLFTDFATNRVGEWESTVKGGPLTKIDTVSIINNPSFEPEKKKFINNLTATPFSTAKFLTSEDPSYQIYTDEKEKKQLLEDGFAEDKLIKLGKDEGGYPKPIITEEMKKAADNLAEDKIQATVSFKTTERKNPNIVIATPKEPKDIPRMDVVEAKKRVRQIESKEDSDAIFNRTPGFKAKLENLAKKAGYKNVTIVNLPEGGLGIRATVGAEKRPSKATVIQEFPNGESIYSWRNGLDPNVGANEYSELAQENKEDYLSIANAGKEQMFKRAGKNTSETPKEVLYVDVSVLKKNNPTKTEAELKKFIMDQNKDKKIRWQYGK